MAPNMDADTSKLAGGFRSIEAKIRMIKERKDGRKYSSLKYYNILNMLSPSDGFTKEDIDILIATNKVSGSIAHGNYNEAMDKIDKFILPTYFPGTQLSRNGITQTKLPVNGTGEEVLEAILSGERMPVVASHASDIFEAYLVAKVGGYIEVMEILIQTVTEMVDSKL